MDILFFATPAELRKWFAKNHNKVTEVLIGFYKKHTGKPSITWPESVDQTLCFGWIDGVLKPIDEDSYSRRFTPRRKGSHWSLVNLNRVPELRAMGLMTEAGEAAFATRTEHKTGKAAYEQGDISLSKEQEKQFKANTKAWAYFQNETASYRKNAIWWVISAKQEATKIRRLATLISDSEAGLRRASQRRS